MRNFYINLSVICLTLIAFTNFTSAVDIRNGESIFTANCAACHVGGQNLIVSDKTLEKDILERNQMNTVSAITYQVTNGKNAMPAFGGRLADPDIEDVANFVLAKSDKGWDKE